MGVVATLDGFPLLSEPTVKWAIRSGVRYNETTLGLRPVDADSLLVSGQHRPVSLVIDDGAGRRQSFDYLYVLAEEPQDSPYMKRVLVVDRRWFWSAKVVDRAFNVRRSIGIKRRIRPGEPPEISPVTPKISHHPASLFEGETLWTAYQVLENVLTTCFLGESDLVGSRPEFSIDPDVGSRLDNLPIEDLRLSDKADRALARVMSYLPEARIKVKPNGNVQVYSGATGAEKQIIEESGPEIVNYGHTSIRSNSRLRPSKIHFLFGREHEMRFDFEEQDVETLEQDGRWMQNVAPIPDFSLIVGEYEYDRGTWTPFPNLLNAWGAPDRFPSLTSAGAWFQAIRRFMVPYLDFWAGVGMAGLRSPNADWMGRIGTIQTHFRRTWRINPRWMGRIDQLKPSLVATRDPVTGTRAPALVYADYCRLGSQRSLWKDLLSDTDFRYGMNVKSHPEPTSNNLADGYPAPASLSVAAHDEGILHFDYLPDPLRIYQSFLPGLLQLQGSSRDGHGLPTVPGPTSDIDDVSQPVTFNAIGESHKPPELSTPFEVSVLLTAIPAPDNSQRMQHLHRVTKEPADVVKAGLLPPALANDIINSHGPEIEIRIGSNIETARVAWLDGRENDIEASFGLRSEEFNIDDLVINLDKEDAGAASLDAIALGLAAKTYAALTDRYQGHRGVAFYGAAEPIGAMEEVNHEVHSDGAVVTTLSLPRRLPEIDLFSLLPDSTRRIILRLAPSPSKI